MEKSIKKSISINEFFYVLNANNVLEDDRAEIIPALFENPSDKRRFLLKESITTISKLEEVIRSIIGDTDKANCIKGIFFVNDDLFIPPALKKILLDNTPIALFVGAGASRLLKMLLWKELADKAVRELRDCNHINYGEWNKLTSDEFTSKQKLSIFHQVINDEVLLNEFYKKVLKAKKNDFGNPYELLWRFEKVTNKPLLKITTNIDQEWENVLNEKYNDEKIVIDEKGEKGDTSLLYEDTQIVDFSKDQKLSEKLLYQIHGSLKHFDTTVITMAQYVEAYRDEKKLKGFLKDVFTKYSVIFIGSSMQEFEILEHCLSDSPNKHFALVGTYFDEDNLFRVKEKYFSKLKIKAIRYYLDFQGYDRLLLLLKNWCNEIESSRKKGFYDSLKLIDEAL